jgi:hypothetical protein
MSKLKIGVVGAGSAGALTLLTLKSAMLNSIDHELYILHDPTISKTHVGESLSPLAVDILRETIGYTFNKDNLQVNETPRYGTLIDWSESNSKIRFIKLYDKHGLHVDSVKFADWVIDSLIKKYQDVFEIKGNVSSINQTDDKAVVLCDQFEHKFDYIFDCRGTPSIETLKSEEYVYIEQGQVNSAILYQEKIKTGEKFTTATSHGNGWMFGIPLIHRKAFGYCYNRNIITRSEALQNFSTMVNLDPEKVVYFDWHHYFKKNVINKRIITTGNRLYFFEPHQALSHHFYMMVARNFYFKYTQHHDNPGLLDSSFNLWYSEQLSCIKDLISLNYVGKTKYTTDFWNKFRTTSLNNLRSSPGFINWCKNKVTNDTDNNYGPHPSKYMDQYIQAYDIDLNEILDDIHT